jgi:hypothetical protein
VLVGVVCALTLGVAVGAAAPPANDAVAAAEVIVGESGRLTATNVEATNEPREPNHEGARSLWYRWTAPAGGQYLFETCSVVGAPPTTFDTIVAVFDGPSPEQLRRIALSDDACGEDQSRVAFQAAAGATYHIAVAGYDNSESGQFTLSWRHVFAPANDAFTAPQTITGASGSVTATNRGATLEPGEPIHGEDAVASVWYTWTAPVSAQMAFETCGSPLDTILGVYTGEDVARLTPVARNDDTCRVGSRVPIAARAGTTYRIAVSGYEEQGDFTLRWLRRPANDQFADARPIRGASGTLTGTTAGATRETGEPSAHKGASVWFRWRATTTAPVAFSTCTASFDTYLFVYRSGRPGRGTLVTSDDDACRVGLGSLVVLFPQRGATYSIALDGLRGATGTYRVEWGTPPPSAWCIVPDIRGLTLTAARAALHRRNCELGRVASVRSTIIPRGRIASQFPLPSSRRRSFGTRVHVELSRGSG